jgi:Enoyl-CoA hydratase/carnithine racemase
MTMNTSDFSTLKIAESTDRFWVRLHRPEVRNAIDQQMVDELHAVCSYLERVPKILILAGTPGQAPTEDKPKGSKGIFVLRCRYRAIA